MRPRCLATVAVVLIAACAQDGGPRIHPSASPPIDPDACLGEGEGKGKNGKDCFITVQVTPPPADKPNDACTAAVAEGQELVVFRFAYGDSRWIIWRVDSPDYEFKRDAKGAQPKDPDAGIWFKDDGAPFDGHGDGGGSRPGPKGSSEYVVKNNGKTFDVGISQTWKYGIRVVAKQAGKPGCEYDPMIRNE